MCCILNLFRFTTCICSSLLILTLSCSLVVQMEMNTVHVHMLYSIFVKILISPEQSHLQLKSQWIWRAMFALQWLVMKGPVMCRLLVPPSCPLKQITYTVLRLPPCLEWFRYHFGTVWLACWILTLRFTMVWVSAPWLTHWTLAPIYAPVEFCMWFTRVNCTASVLSRSWLAVTVSVVGSCVRTEHVVYNIKVKVMLGWKSL